MTDARISQVAREVLHGTSAPHIRVSGLAREVVHGNTAPVRVGGVSREVLHSFPTFLRVGGMVREVLRRGLTFSIPNGSSTWIGGTPVSTNPGTFTIPAGAATWVGGTPLNVNPNYFPIPGGTANWVGGEVSYSAPEPSLFDINATVISQYVDSPTIVRLVQNLDAYFNPSANMDAFYNLVWNVETAQGWGLDVWGRIVGVGRVLHVSNGTESFGFEEGGTTDYTGFGQAPFFGGGQVTSNFSLSDNAYRTLIFAKALANITDGSIPAINQILLNLFPGRGDCYVTDGQNMTMTYAFTFALTPVEAAIVGQSGVLPKSTGVSVSVVTPP